MQLATKYPLYKRISAGNNELPAGYVNTAAMVDVTDIVFGKAIDANNVWYKASDGYFYWSGGFADQKFLLPGKSFLQLSKDEQYILVSKAMQYYYEDFKRQGIEFTGMSATMKRKDSANEYLEYYALVVHVKQKGIFAEKRIPEKISFAGYEIPTDVITISIPTALTLGDKIQRTNSTAWGTSGIVLKRNDGINKFEKYLITNYHVLCKDLLSASPRKMNLEEEDLLDDPGVLVSNENTSEPIGQLTRATLDNMIDIALVSIAADVDIQNIFHDATIIKKIRTLDSIKNNFKPFEIVVKTYGAFTKQIKSGFIVSFDTQTPVSYLSGNFVHEMSGLIKADLFSQEGDSGSIVLDNDNAVVGVLFAGSHEPDFNYSFIIPIEKILTTFKIAIP